MFLLCFVLSVSDDTKVEGLKLKSKQILKLIN